MIRTTQLLKFVPSFLLAAGWPLVAVAQPTVSAVNQQSGTMVITGSRFGTHGGYGGSQSFLNAAWHNFENGSFEGGNIEQEQKATNQWSLQSSGGRPNSSKYAQKVYISDEGGELFLQQNGTTGKWFMSFWMKVKDVASQQSGKFFRIWGDGGDVYASTGGGNLQIRGFSECDSCSPAPNTVWGSPNSFSASTWQRVDIEIAQNPDWFAIYLDGRLQWRRSSTLSGAEREKWIPNPFGGNGHTVGVGGMLDAPDRGYPANGSYGFDDIFVDYTWARVELGNASTWSACTQKEIQIPRQWADGQVTVQTNKGAFSSGQSVYAYVVDASGAVNANGFRVTLGSTSTTPLPSAPTNIHIIQ